jgi:para-nitrobenzyl esterase
MYLPVLLAAAVCCLLFAAQSTDAAPLLVNTTTGNYMGRMSPNNSSVYRWTGIRYASAPVGSLRWRSPVPYTMSVAEKSQVKNATSFGASCPQVNPYNPSVSSNMAEDCLFLNVWSPMDADTAADPNTQLLPVAIWIHGGGMLPFPCNVVALHHFELRIVAHTSFLLPC